jgi:hypothetical protein
VKKTLPFHNSKKNWTCRENGKVEWAVDVGRNLNIRGWRLGGRFRNVKNCTVIV